MYRLLKEQLDNIAKEQIISKFEIPGQTFQNEEELFLLLVNRIAYLIDSDPNGLFSMLYRLDIDEHKLKKAMETDPAKNIAYLIIERQVQRMRTRKMYSRSLDKENH